MKNAHKTNLYPSPISNFISNSLFCSYLVFIFPFPFPPFLVLVTSDVQVVVLNFDSSNQVICDVIGGAWGKKF